MATALERAARKAALETRLSALQTAILRFWENMAVQEYSREDRAAKYADIEKMERSERRLIREIAALGTTGGGKLRNLNVRC